MNRDADLFAQAARVVAAGQPEHKIALTGQLVAAWRAGDLELRDTRLAPEPIGEPGRPSRPRLVPARELPRRRLATREGQAALVHALAHIEFNAINLALDAVYRFRALPRQFYDDWLQVADEEVYHFTLLRDHLRELGADYGDLPAHNGLWEMAVETAHDPLVRMALVPRVLEARGLDVSPGMMERLREAGNRRAAAILEIILRDEVGHVAIGSHWFRHLCAERALEPQTTFRRLLGRYMRGRVKGPFYREARLRAGFTEAELIDLESME